MTDVDDRRALMVEQQIVDRGVTDPKVLAAMRTVPREAFVPVDLAARAYHDEPLLIGNGQTISQPYIVALMLAALQLTGGERVLDIGTGSGYAAALVSQIAAQVYTVERLQRLADAARQRFVDLGYRTIQLRHGDGSLGWVEQAPYDAIIVGAAAPRVAPVLREQLAIGGRLVIPVGADRDHQQLIRETRLGEDRFKREQLTGVRFVPLIGAEGWPPDAQ